MNYNNKRKSAFANYIYTTVQKFSLNKIQNQSNIYDNLRELKNYVYCDIEDEFMLNKMLIEDESN